MTDNTIKSSPAPRRREGRINIIIACAVSFICCLALPFSSNSIVGIVTVIICSAFAIRVSKRKIPAVLILLSLFATFGLSNGLPLVTVLLSGVIGCGAFAWLISKTESPLLAIIPALAYSISTVVTKSWFGSLLTLFFIIPAIILAQTYEKMNSRVSSLFRVTVGFLSYIALAVILSVVYFTGEFRIEIIGEVLDSLRDSSVKVLASMEITLVNGNVEKLMSETEAYNYVSQIISLLPAIVAVTCSLFAFFAQKIQFSVFTYTDGEQEFVDLRRVFIMSPAAAVIFILSFLIYTITATSSSSATVSTVCSNLYLIFIPGLAFMGIKTFLSGRSALSRSGCGSGLIVLLFIFLLFFSSGAALLMAACFGAFSAIEGPIRKHLSNKKDD